MPFDIFARRSFRRRAPDPFGRVLAEPKPDPEIMDFRNPFRLRHAVGMEGLNDRRDVAKVENLLGRTGALDLDKTDGLTGFFGARADEAVRKFQRDRGLKVDGLINPNGPTIKTLFAEAGGNSGANRPLPATTLQPTTDPRPNSAKRIARRLLDMQKAGIDPAASFRVRRLAQAEANGGEGGKGGNGGTPPSTQAPPPGTKPGETPETPKSPAPPAPKTGKGAGQDTSADILDKVREIVEELNKNPDPRAGDIDTDEPETAPQRPPQKYVPVPPVVGPEGPNRGGKKERRSRPLSKEQKDAIRNIADNFLGALSVIIKNFRGMPQFMAPPEKFLRNPKHPKDPA